MTPHPALQGKAPAVDKAFAILDFVGREKRASFTLIYKSLGLPKSSSHRLIESLVQLGMLRHIGEGHYVLGLRLFELGGLAAHNRNVRRDALPVMHELSSRLGLVSHLGALDGNEAVYLVRADPTRHLCHGIHSAVNSWEGKRVSLNSSALGKVLLAWLPSAQVEPLLRIIALPRKTERTIADSTSLRTHLIEVKHRGWAVDDGEDVANLFCIAAPVRDIHGQVPYALSITGLRAQATPQWIEDRTAALINSANRISRTLGFHPAQASRSAHSNDW